MLTVATLSVIISVIFISALDAGNLCNPHRTKPVLYLLPRAAGI